MQKTNYFVIITSLRNSQLNQSLFTKYFDVMFLNQILTSVPVIHVLTEDNVLMVSINIRVAVHQDILVSSVKLVRLSSFSQQMYNSQNVQFDIADKKNKASGGLDLTSINISNL